MSDRILAAVNYGLAVMAVMDGSKWLAMANLATAVFFTFYVIEDLRR